MIDLLPNASLSPWTWLLAGALVGRAEALRAFSGQQVRAQQESLMIGGSASSFPRARIDADTLKQRLS
jgi:hypothetical protein